MQDKLLIRRCIKADPKAQKELYDRYATHWFMISLRYMKSRADAADVLQNALINIYSKLNQFNAEIGSFKSWSSRIVVNESIMMLRKQKAKFGIVEINDEALNIEMNRETIIDKLSAEELTNQIQSMPEGYRVVFNMFAIEGYSHKEIAVELGISEGTSKSQYYKARNFLKKQIEVVF